MTYNDYLAHYFDIKDMLIFLGIALVCALVLTLILVPFGKRGIKGRTAYIRDKRIYNHTYNLIQRFYEMICSATSILSFLAVYYLIDKFVLYGEFRNFWDKHSDMILLVMIILSIVINNYLDKLLIPLKKIDHEERASVRVMGMIYIMIIFMYIKFIYGNDNYDGFIMYFLGLMVGRFVYFDASFKDFIKTFSNALRNFPILIMGLVYTGIMCYVGFSTDYLLKSNGVLVSTFFAHIYMIIAIFIVHHSHIIRLFVKKPYKEDYETDADTDIDTDTLDIEAYEVADDYTDYYDVDYSIHPDID